MKYIYGRKPVLEAMRNHSVDKIYTMGGEGSLVKILAIARDEKIPISKVNKKKLDELSQGENHQGIVALVSGYFYWQLEEMLQEVLREGEGRLLILDHLEDPHNFGAIARSALFLGFHGIIIPKNRSVMVNDTVYKASAGAIEQMKVAQVTNLTQAIEQLKERGFWVYAADMAGEDIKKANLSGNIAIIIGNEGKGVGKNVLNHADGSIHIPSNSNFDSLNASVAASIIMYEVVREKRQDYEKI